MNKPIEIKWCEKCNISIPRGEFRLKGLCDKCWNKGRNKWRIFVLALIAISIGGVFGVKERSTLLDKKIDKVASESLERDEMIIAWVRDVIGQIENWAGNVNNRLVELGEITHAQQKELDALSAEIKDIKLALLSTDESQKVSKEYAETRILEIRNRITNIERDVEALKAIPAERLEQTIRSVVGIGVHATMFDPMGGAKEDDFMNGSGAIFKKEKTADGYRYYVLTAYHCYQDYLQYLELKATLPKEQQKDAYPLIFLYDGSVRSVIRGEVVFPNKFSPSFVPIADWIILSFESKLDLPVIELADDTPIRLGDKTYSTGVYPTEAPAIYSGVVACVRTSYGNCTAYQGNSEPGMSGGAILNKDLKLIGMTLAMSVSRAGGDSAMGFGWNIVELRKRWKVAVPDNVKNLLGIK